MRFPISAAMLAIMLAAAPALFAQQDAPSGGDPPLDGMEPSRFENPAAPRTPEDFPAATTKQESLAFVSAQARADWFATSMIGRTVWNDDNQALGKINDVVFDRNGAVVAVLLGVGGFLGIGEKNVGVSYRALELRRRGPPRGLDSMEMPAGARARPEDGAASGDGATLQAPEQQAASLAEDPRHGDWIIMLRATPEMLDEIPAYRYLDRGAPPASNRVIEPRRAGSRRWGMNAPGGGRFGAAAAQPAIN